MLKSEFSFWEFFLQFKIGFFLGVVGGMSSICFVMQCDAQQLTLL